MSASGAGDPGVVSHRGHADTEVAIIPVPLRYRVSDGAGWAGVSGGPVSM